MFETSESRNVSPMGGFFILWGFVFGGAAIGGLLGVGIMSVMTGGNVLDLPQAILKPEYVNAVRLFQFVSTLFMFFLPAIALAYIMNRKPYKWLGYQEGFTTRQLLLVLGITFICLPLSGALGELNQIIPLPKSLETLFRQMENDYEKQVDAVARIRSFGEYLLSLFIMAILAAVFEETLFRGGLQRVLIDWTKKPMVAIVITSILFSAIHLSFYGFIPRVALGIVLGLIYYYSKSLWLSIILHFLYNGVAVTGMYYMSLQGKPAKEVLDQKFPIWVAIPVMLLLVWLLKGFKKISFNRNISKIPAMDAPSVRSDMA
jgi:uncharacterized protein